MPLWLWNSVMIAKPSTKIAWKCKGQWGFSLQRVQGSCPLPPKTKQMKNSERKPMLNAVADQVWKYLPSPLEYKPVNIMETILRISCSLPHISNINNHVMYKPDWIRTCFKLCNLHFYLSKVPITLTILFGAPVSTTYVKIQMLMCKVLKDLILTLWEKTKQNKVKSFLWWMISMITTHIITPTCIIFHASQTSSEVSQCFNLHYLNLGYQPTHDCNKKTETRILCMTHAHEKKLLMRKRNNVLGFCVRNRLKVIPRHTCIQFLQQPKHDLPNCLWHDMNWKATQKTEARGSRGLVKYLQQKLSHLSSSRFSDLPFVIGQHHKHQLLSLTI